MPPKKKNLSAASGPSTQTNKRTVESLLPGLAKRRKYADDRGPNEKRVMDSYCWICHQSEKDIDCKDCQRVYHTHCLNRVSLEFSDNTCPECQLKSLNNVNQNTFLTVEILREILSVAATEFRKKFKSPDKNMFFQWPNIEDSELVRIIDFDLLEDNIKDESNPYHSLSEIMSDIKWIHHNYCILDGVDSPTAKEAEGFVRMFQKEISDIEDCPKCYYNMFVKRRTDDFFINICEPPHDIIWAWLKGSSPWPAKCLRVENGKAHVRFFGTHDKSNIPIGNKKCLAISLTHPTHKKSKLTDANLIPKKREYKIAVDELLIYIDRYERKFCKKFVYYEPGTPYKGEVTKPGRKKRNRNRRNVSTVSNPEENDPLPPTTESDLNEPNGNQSFSSSQIEVVTSLEVEEEDSEVTIQVVPSGEDENIENLKKTKGNISNSSPSPVVTASMVCEVENSEDSQSIRNNSLTPSVYTSQNTDTSLSQSNFQPLASCSSTPLSINSNNQLSINRRQNLLSNNGMPEELVRYSESQQRHSDVHPVENIPLNNSSPSASEEVSVDEDVVFVSANKRNTRMNPSSVLPYIFSGNPDLQSLFRDGRYVFDSLFIRCWAAANRLAQAPEIITGFMEENKKITLEKNKLQREKEELERDNMNLKETIREKDAKHAEENAKHAEEVNSFKMRCEKMEGQLLYAEDVNQKAIANANTICRGLYWSYVKKFQGADLSLLEEKDAQLRKEIAESAKKTQVISEATQKLQLMKRENTELKDTNRELKAMIHELKATIQELKTQDRELKSTNHELVDKLEELTKLQRENEREKEVTGIDDKHLNDLEFDGQVQQPSSSSVEFHEHNHPIIVHDNASGSPKKSSRSSSSESQDASNRRESHEAGPTDHFCQETISQEHVKTIAKKTSVFKLEHKTITTTNARNEGNIYHRPHALYGPPYPTPAILCPIMAPFVPPGAVNIVYGPPPGPLPVNPAYDLSQHIAHRERYHANSPSNFLQNLPRRDRQPKDLRKKQSRSTHHDKI